MKFFAAILSVFGAASLCAQPPQVPDQIQFGGITLTIRGDAKHEIQKDVNLLTQHAGYFSVKANRAKMYFPIIEKILSDEGVPLDFKFLALQESSLVPDAVSSSNAVGFWQFKDFTALEMGLRIDEAIDERMNVVAATRGAAKYLAKNNQQFNNWLYTLQSYQMGAGGVKRAVGDLQAGSDSMDVTADTYWYVKRFLAHKIAFENSLNGETEMRLIPFQNSVKKSLGDIAKELSVEENILKEYNKWLKTDFIPDDKPYTVIVPVGKLDSNFNTLYLPAPKTSSNQKQAAVPKVNEDSVLTINGINAIRAKEGESISQLALRANITISKLLKFNEQDFSYIAKEGDILFLAKKKNDCKQEFHKVKMGDDLWRISQLYGIKIKKLKKYNQQLTSESLLVGDYVWLNAKNHSIPQNLVENESEIAALNKAETFDWVVKEPQMLKTDSIISAPVAKITKQDSIISNNSANPFIDNIGYHTVAPGETLYSIATLYNLKVIELIKLNNMSINDLLKPGQVLVLAEKKSKEVALDSVISKQSQVFHEVRSSDTLYSIARQYGVTIRDLMEWNNKQDFSLSRGERLLVKKK